jgi:hypothetical protein
MKSKITVANQDLESAKLFKVVELVIREDEWMDALGGYYGYYDESSINITAETMSLSDIKAFDLIKHAHQGQIVNSPNFSFTIEDPDKLNPEYAKIEDLLVLLKKKRDSIFDNKERNSEQRRSQDLKKCDEIEEKLKKQKNSIPRLLKSSLPTKLVQEFKQAVGNDKKGVYLQWDDMSEGIWYIEFIGSEAERAQLLGSTPDTLTTKDIMEDEFEINTGFIKAALEKGGSKTAKTLKKIKFAQATIKAAIHSLPT